MNKNFDVLIIGASVAGSSLALRLAQSNIRTAIIDKALFPRRKACGEGLSDVALAKLSELGLAKEIQLGEHAPFYGYKVWLGNFSVDLVRKGITTNAPKGIGIQRHVLDQILVKELSNHRAVQTFLGQKVRKVDRSELGYTVSLEKGTIHGKYLVLADGSNSLLASRFKIPRKTGKSPSWGISWIMKGNFLRPLESVAVFVKNGFEIYCTPIASDKLNVCFLARKHLISKLTNPEFSIQEMNDALERIGFVGETIGSPKHIGPINCTRRPIVHNDIFLVGDACESLDPISGMGMTHALITSELVSNSLVAILQGKQRPEFAVRELRKQREIFVRPYRGFARLSGVLLRGTRNHGRLLALLARTSLPSKIRNVLQPQILDSPVHFNISSILLTLVGFNPLN